MVDYRMMMLSQAIFDSADGESGERFPELPESLSEEAFEAWRGLAESDRDSGSSPEFPIYLGSRLSPDSNPDLPLLISPSYRRRGERVRQVLTVGSKVLQIRDEELDAWIDKVMAAKKP